MRKLLIIILSAAIRWLSFDAPAVCIYNPDGHAIWIYDYTEDLPAGPRQLMFAEQLNDWGLVSYDRSNDTCTVKANLWIGRNDGSDTFFQLGGPAHPRTTLVLQGDLVIYPVGPQRVNRLTIGCPDNPDVQARLLFDNGPGKNFTMRAGAYYRGNSMTPGAVTGGELHVYHGTISAANPQYPIGRHLYLYLDSVVLNQAAISRVQGMIGYGLNAKNSRIDDCVFEDSGTACGWGEQTMRGVIFRRLQTAFSDSTRYPLAATLTECRFEDNHANWALSAGNLYLVDCEVQPPRQGNRYAARTNAVFSVQHAKVGAQRALVSARDMPESIRAISSRHVAVKVLDARERPVKNARVAARCRQDDRILRAAVTGADGLTPGRDAPGALLLDEWEESAGDVAHQPVRREFSYAIEITPPQGGAVQVYADLRPTQSWQVVEAKLPAR